MGSVSQMYHNKVVIALDCGTTSVRSIAFDHECHVVAIAQMEYPLHFPKPGWAEHNPDECWEAAVSTLKAVREKLSADCEVQALGITNHRESIVVWDKETGKPLHNTILWLDTRTQGKRDKMIETIGQSGKEEIRHKCGLPIETYFSALKLSWLYEHAPEFKAAADAGRAMVGTIDCWLVYMLTQGKTYVTDVTNASRTMLMNIETCNWDPSLIKAFNLPTSLNLPRIASSSEVYGHVTAVDALRDVPISGILGDQQAALVGQGCLAVGSAKNTYGTGCFLLFNTGTQLVRSSAGLLTTAGYQLGPNKPVHYAVEGSIAIGGAAVQWLRDKLGIIKSAPEVNDLASQVTDSGGVVFVPAFSGLFAPHWRPDARGVIIGLTQYSSKCHIARATLDSVAYQTKEVIRAILKDTGCDLTSLRVDGGMTASDLTMQIQADVLGIDVVRPEMRETTALGAAFAAGLAVGFWTSEEDILKAREAVPVAVYTPKWDDAQRNKGFATWSKAVERTLNWAVTTEN